MTNTDALAERIRPILSGREGVSCAGTWKDSLIVRLDRNEHEATLAEPHTKPANITGRVMRGWAVVEPAGIASDHDLRAWLDRAAAFAASLAPK